MAPGKSGFISVLGWTNVGKSTLLNRLAGQRVVITSPKEQTTRNATTVILTEARGQVVFIDTPGLHRPRHLLSELMIKEAASTLGNSDAALHLVSPDVKADDSYLRELLARFHGPKILVVNKIDLLGKDELIRYLGALAGLEAYREVVPVSAVTGDNAGRLLDVCFAALPEGAGLYPEDQISDRKERFFMAEIIREKIVTSTRQEIPYATAVMVDESKWDADRGLWRIQATIYVEKESQKGIVIGAGGVSLKAIGQKARRDLEVFLQARVYLELWVKVRKNWTRDPQFLEELLRS